MGTNGIETATYECSHVAAHRTAFWLFYLNYIANRQTSEHTTKECLVTRNTRPEYIFENLWKYKLDFLASNLCVRVYSLSSKRIFCSFSLRVFSTLLPFAALNLQFPNFFKSKPVVATRWGLNVFFLFVVAVNLTTILATSCYTCN